MDKKPVATYKQVKTFSNDFSLSYNKAKLNAEKEGYSFKRKTEYLKLKRGEIEKIEGKRLKKEIKEYEKELKEKEIKEAREFGGGKVFTYTLVAGIGTREGEDMISCDYRIRLYSKHKLDSAIVKRKLTAIYNNLFVRYPLTGFSSSSLTPSFEEGTAYKVFLGERYVDAQFIRYKNNIAIRRKKFTVYY